MALFTEQEQNEKKEYIALLNKGGDLISFIHPVKGVEPEALVAQLTKLGLNVEIRESQPRTVDIELV